MDRRLTASTLAAFFAGGSQRPLAPPAGHLVRRWVAPVPPRGQINDHLRGAAHSALDAHDPKRDSALFVAYRTLRDGGMTEGAFSAAIHLLHERGSDA